MLVPISSSLTLGLKPFQALGPSVKSNTFVKQRHLSAEVRLAAEILPANFGATVYVHCISKTTGSEAKPEMHEIEQ